MRKQFSIPLFYLVLAAGLGILLRWNLLSPFEGFTHGYWLHAHSHVMFLGWVFNFFNLAFLYNAFGDQWRPPYRTLFIINQLLILGMLFFFPVQGYGSVTIPLSVAHTLVSAFFCIRFIRDTRDLRSSPARKFAVWSLILFLISSLGPFALGPIMAQGLGQSKWYYFAIYFYLHFQYNGFFLFGLLSLLSRWAEYNGLTVINAPLMKAGTVLFVACFPTYALSLLWADVHLLFNVVGLTGAALQLWALAILWRAFRATPIHRRIQKSARVIAFVVAFSFGLKLILQTLSAFPVFAALAYDHRYYVIAYLHLVLIGVISFSMLMWYAGKGMLHLSRVWLLLLTVGFVLSELVMVLIPSIDILAHHSVKILFGVSVLMFLGFSGFAYQYVRDQKT